MWSSFHFLVIHSSLFIATMELLSFYRDYAIEKFITNSLSSSFIYPHQINVVYLKFLPFPQNELKIPFPFEFYWPSKNNVAAKKTSASLVDFSWDKLLKNSFSDWSAFSLEKLKPTTVQGYKIPGLDKWFSFFFLVV